jgi:hypothetical protein
VVEQLFSRGVAQSLVAGVCVSPGQEKGDVDVHVDVDVAKAS